MLKFFILLISSLLLFNACSIKNPLSKKSKITYIDCPKTLILAPASKINKNNTTITLNKNYSINCYFFKNDSNEVILEFNYSLELLATKLNQQSIDVEFLVFVTNKEEDQKIHNQKFNIKINTDFNESEKEDVDKLMTNYTNEIKFNKKFYEEGVKLFIGIN
jgi:hypothetical protein